MKKITYFYLKSCPYCIQARMWMEELFRAHPEYKSIPMTEVEEHKQAALADTYPYYLVPTYFVGEGAPTDEKLHEGAATYEGIEAVFRRAYEAV